MYVAGTPMSSHTVRFAKAYRAEQIRAVDQAGIVSEFSKPYGSRIRRVKLALIDVGARAPAPRQWGRRVSSVR
jgi:hypothetical protein